MRFFLKDGAIMALDMMISSKKMMAEILINDVVYGRYIRSIYVKDQVSKKAIEERLASDLKMYNINVVVDPAKFF